jgi:predicted phosphoribosyltransferase
MTFMNRFDAGRQLGAALRAHPRVDPVVLGVLRGGVPVAAEVAHILQAPLELCVVRKLFSPGSPSFAIGAVAERGAVHLDNGEITRLQLSRDDVQRAIRFELAEVLRLGELLRDGPPLSLHDRDAIVVDDAVTTIDTLRAAACSLRDHGPRSLVLAVPVGALSLLGRLHAEFDRVVCLCAEPILGAAGAHYHDFPPVSEAEVAGLLAETERSLLAETRRTIAGPRQVADRARAPARGAGT